MGAHLADVSGGGGATDCANDLRSSLAWKNAIVCHSDLISRRFAAVSFLPCVLTSSRLVVIDLVQLKSITDRHLIGILRDALQSQGRKSSNSAFRF